MVELKASFHGALVGGVEVCFVPVLFLAGFLLSKKSRKSGKTMQKDRRGFVNKEYISFIPDACI